MDARDLFSGVHTYEANSLPAESSPKHPFREPCSPEESRWIEECTAVTQSSKGCFHDRRDLMNPTGPGKPVE